jgi:DNA invertase Pin-like site-specific DNA recombinase
MGLRAGLYLRVSDDDGGRSRSVPEQEGELQADCGREGWSIKRTYREPDRSASRFAKKDRPFWNAMMDDLTSGLLDVVVLWEPSRGDRKTTGWSQFLDECRDRGVLIHIKSHHRTYDVSNNPRDWKSLMEDGIDSAWESEKTSMRIRRDLADAAERGRPHGRLAYGYTRQYDVRTGKLDKQVPHPEQAPVAREIITRIAGGDAISAIITDLNARGIPGPTGGRWARSTICRLVLEGVVYIGKRRHNGGPLLDGDWLPIADEDVYWRAVAVLSDPKRKPAGGGIRPGRSRWLLSYIAKCAVCGGPISARHLPRAGSAQAAYYRCISGHAAMPVEFMDAAVSEAVITWAAKPGVYEAVMQRDDADAGAARAEADAERGRLAAFEEDAIAGRISSASFARIAAGIESRIAELDDHARRADPVLRDLFAKGNRVENVRACWAGMPLTARRHVVSALVAEPGYLRLRPSGANGRDHSAVLDVRRIEMRLSVDPRSRQ